MKKNLLSYFLIAMFSLFIFSCNDDDDPSVIQQGEVEFGFNLKDITNSKSAKADVAEPAALIVSIKNTSGTMAYDTEEIELFNMNGYFISKPLSLLVDSYTLEKFLVVDADGNVIYASPLEGSDLAYLVNDPLPIEFNVSKDETVKLVPEVLSTETLTPEDFGYTTFSFDIVETFDFLLSVFVYDETAENFELTDAMLSVSANENTIFTGTLEAITNQIKVNDGFDSYILTVEKEGYTSYVDTFTNAELKLYFSSEDNGPLKVILLNSSVDPIITFISDQNILQEIKLWKNSEAKMKIDWDDGNIEDYLSTEILHSYNIQNIYEVKLYHQEGEFNSLHIFEANVTQIDLSKAINLNSLFISGNKLSNIDLSPLTLLQNLYLNGNSFDNINLSNNLELKKLGVGNNNLSSLDLSNNNEIEELFCHKNNLQTLNISHLMNLKRLTIDDNQFSSIDVSNNTALENLTVSKNSISSLDLSQNNNLKYLYMGFTSISSIDISNLSELEVLNATNANLSNLDISGNQKIWMINVGQNNLNFLDVTNNISLKRIDCYQNNLTSLDLSRLTELNSLWAVNNNFNSTAVDQILIDVLTTVQNNPREGSIHLTENSQPTSQGLTAKDELINTYGWTVETD